MNYGTGRIQEIIKALKDCYKVTSIEQLLPKQKLDCFCEVLQLTPDQFDSLIVNNSAVLRTIKGHAFELVFDYLVAKNGYVAKEIGGDQSIDRIVNSKTLQLKTPTLSGTHEGIVQYKTHKTHGAKSEKESMSYYHHKDEFADYLVGLISYEPLRIIFLRRDELPTHPKNSKYIISPFQVKWVDHPGLNNFNLIGINKVDLTLNYLKIKKEEELLPKTSGKLDLPTDIILNAVLREGNFRIWDMNIRGFAREAAFINCLKLQNIKLIPSSKYKKLRADKADLALLLSEKNKYALFQIKGPTLNQCKFDKDKSIVAVETQLTRGRVSDHPTQSRLYLYKDFHYLIVVLDPCLSNRFLLEIGDKNCLEWQFYAIPSKKLLRHHKFTKRLKSMQFIKYTELQKYRIDNDWLELWRKEDKTSS